uniref:EF-hand domain-containing protein n=1 Tax=Helicotheca tamesis TaxID=374047 RepID=A0A7S2E4B9_9STRA
MDVAGATLMAAGGSAPELFTSLFGTFVTEDEVGIGTVVGSAVFNVLFVIAMCALLSHEVLTLTGWPLTRDSMYYAFGLITLGLFVGVISEGEIELWEAIVLFVEYLGYIVLMYFNETLMAKLHVGKKPEPAVDESLVTAVPSAVNGAAEAVTPAESSDESDAVTNPSPSIVDHKTNGNAEDKMENEPETASRPNLNNNATPSARSLMSGGSNASSIVAWSGTFRAGVLKLIRDPEHFSLEEKAGIGLVAQMAGNVDKVFKEVDVDGNGEIDKEELKMLFARLDFGDNASEEELERIFVELDRDNDGKISEEDFKHWYIQSEERIRSRVKPIFESFDTDKSGTITKEKIRSLLERVEPTVTDEDVNEAMTVMYKDGDRDVITFEEFSDWYVRSMIYHRQKKKMEEEDNGICEGLYPPTDTDEAWWIAWPKYLLLLPIVLVLALTVPDVRRPGWANWCYLAFFLSIAWIGVFSYFMVEWAEVIGNTIGIPSVVMGLTLLAAGTSVPDLLSSVIVARMGEGDMALSSSIGSNIFDILVGLPLPWIIYTAWPSKPDTIVIGSDNVWISIFVLLGMLIFIIVVIHCQGWRLTRMLALLMFIFYFAFLAQAIVLELPFETCD